MKSKLERHICLTTEQQQQYNEDGFFLIKDALSTQQVNTLLDLSDKLDSRYRKARHIGPNEPFQMRNIVALDPLFKNLMTDEYMLSLAVDLFGYNIQLRTSHLDIRPPMKKERHDHELGSNNSFFPWHYDQPDYGWPNAGGIVPHMEMKIGYYLTDLSHRNSGAICVVRGSHKRDPWITKTGKRIIDPERIVEVNVSSGTAMVWRTALYHCLTPNLSNTTRKCLYYGYQPRWMRPSDFDHQQPELLNGCSPIELQLLGELGTGRKNYIGDDPNVFPVSRYWRPQPEDIPLKEWALEQLAR